MRLLFVASVLSWTNHCNAFSPSPKRSVVSASPPLEYTSVAYPEIAVSTPTGSSIFDTDVEVPAVPRLGTIMKMLPKDTWKVDTQTSLLYFTLDLLAVICSMGFLDAVVTSDAYHSMQIWEQALSVMPLQVLTGFAMWCTWCIGHDAGHGTVSKSTKFGKGINRLVGEITHSMICLTPFVPWALSHKKHHLNHYYLLL